MRVDGRRFAERESADKKGKRLREGSGGYPAEVFYDEGFNEGEPLQTYPVFYVARAFG